MTKDKKAVGLIDDEEEAMLNTLCLRHLRSRSDMIRFLIRQEYEKLQTTKEHRISERRSDERRNKDRRTTDISLDELERLR